jgi:hypothetical protein
MSAHSVPTIRSPMKFDSLVVEVSSPEILVVVSVVSILTVTPGVGTFSDTVDSGDSVDTEDAVDIAGTGVVAPDSVVPTVSVLTGTDDIVAGADVVLVVMPAMVVTTGAMVVVRVVAGASVLVIGALVVVTGVLVVVTEALVVVTGALVVVTGALVVVVAAGALVGSVTGAADRSAIPASLLESDLDQFISPNIDFLVPPFVIAKDWKSRPFLADTILIRISEEVTVASTYPWIFVPERPHICRS